MEEEGFRALVAAARRSSVAVLQWIDASVRAMEPAIDATILFTLDETSLRCVRSCGARAAQARATALDRTGDSLPARAALLAQPLALARAGELVLAADRSAIAIPLVADCAVRAVWYGSSATAKALSRPEEMSALVACAGDVYLLALERENDRNEATFDSLTGVLAPRAFRLRLHEMVGRMRDSILSLWFVDTDRFKQINDERGHETGDRVLQSMAALLHAHAVPESDVVGRKGGDEFCMALRGVPKMQAIERAQRFCSAVRSHDFGGRVRVTASVGVASFPFDARDAAALLEAADAAMYHAKRSGRDRVAYAVEGAGFALYE